MSMRGGIDGRCGGSVASRIKGAVDCLLLTSSDAQRRVEGDVSRLGSPVEEVDLLVHGELLDTVPVSATKEGPEKVSGKAATLGRNFVQTRNLLLARPEREAGVQIICGWTHIRRRGETTFGPSNLRVHGSSSSRDHRDTIDERVGTSTKNSALLFPSKASNELGWGPEGSNEKVRMFAFSGWSIVRVRVP